MNVIKWLDKVVNYVICFGVIDILVIEFVVCDDIDFCEFLCFDDCYYCVV